MSGAGAILCACCNRGPCLSTACIDVSLADTAFGAFYTWTRPNGVRDFAAKVSANFGTFSHSETVNYHGSNDVTITFTGTGNTLTNEGLLKHDVPVFGGCSQVAVAFKSTANIDGGGYTDFDGQWTDQCPYSITFSIDTPTPVGAETISNYTTHIEELGVAYAGATLLSPTTSTVDVSFGGKAFYRATLVIEWDETLSGSTTHKVARLVCELKFSGSDSLANSYGADTTTSSTTATLNRGSTYGGHVWTWDQAWSWELFLNGSSSGSDGGTVSTSGGSVELDSTTDHNTGYDYPRTIQLNNSVPNPDIRTQACYPVDCAPGLNLLYPEWGAFGAPGTTQKVNTDLWLWTPGSAGGGELNQYLTAIYSSGSDPSVSSVNITSLTVATPSEGTPACDEGPCPINAHLVDNGGGGGSGELDMPITCSGGSCSGGAGPTSIGISWTGSYWIAIIYHLYPGAPDYSFVNYGPNGDCPPLTGWVWNSGPDPTAATLEIEA